MSVEAKSWPEFVGQDANEIVERLKAQGTFKRDKNLPLTPLECLSRSGYNPQVKPQGSPVSRDYRLDRVRLFVDEQNVIVQTPHTG